MICESDHGDYAATSHLDNQKLYRDLTGMLAASGLCGFGFAIDLIAQQNVFPGSPDIAYYKGFAEVLEAMTAFGMRYGELVKFTFDTRKESEFNAGVLYDMFRGRAEEEDRHMFDNITFAFSRKEPKIQVADLMARETMKALDKSDWAQEATATQILDGAVRH